MLLLPCWQIFKKMLNNCDYGVLSVGNLILHSFSNKVEEGYTATRELPAFGGDSPSGSCHAFEKELRRVAKSWSKATTFIKNTLGIKHKSATQLVSVLCLVGVQGFYIFSSYRFQDSPAGSWATNQISRSPCFIVVASPQIYEKFWQFYLSKSQDCWLFHSVGEKNSLFP